MSFVLWLVTARAGRAVLALGVVLAVGVAIYAKGRHEGAEGVLDDIRETNEEAINAADYAHLGLVECYRAGGVWDFWAARCAEPEPGNGE